MCRRREGSGGERRSTRDSTRGKCRNQKGEKMLTKKIVLIAVIVSFLVPPVSMFAQDAGALLDLLVRKKLITDQEAEEVRAELTKEAATTSGGKWKLSSPITEIELYGDLRLRYQYNGGQTTDNSPLARPANGVAGRDDWQERERERYRLRLGLRGTLVDDWFFGIRFETNTNPRSTNVTFGDDSGVNGPFSKDSDRINVGQAYLGYKGFRDVTLTAGRMPNPLVNTPMVWDPDINPEGLAEQWKHTYNFEFGGGSTTAAAESYSKEGGKGVAAPVASEPFKLKLDLFVNFAQFIYDDANPENPLGLRARNSAGAGAATHQTGQLIPNTDAFLLAWQVGGRLTFPKNIFLQIAPTIYNYTGNGDTFNIHYQGGSPFVTNAVSLAQNQTGINSLLVFDMPWEIGWKVGELPMHVFGDFSVNLEGDDRATAAGHPSFGDERYAYQVGLGVGQLKQKRDWQIDVAYQHSEQYALDPNLVDDDIFDGRQNMHGIIVRAGYALSDAVIFNVTWNYGWRINDNLGTGGTPIAIGINPLDQYQFFVADLNIKF
jgi:Putative porin